MSIFILTVKFFFRDIIQILKAKGRELTKALPINASVGNMVRRILKIIREEYVSGQEVNKL